MSEVAAHPHYLLLYTYVEDMLERRDPFREAHLNRLRIEKDAGRVLMAGALGNPPTGGAIAFRGVTPEAIEEFVQNDPYMQAGLITAWRIEPWTVI